MRDSTVQMVVRESKVKWTKKLYIKTGYPDNHVDDSFLNLKKINGSLTIPNNKTAIY
jgi:hypothetical protein